MEIATNQGILNRNTGATNASQCSGRIRDAWPESQRLAISGGTHSTSATGPLVSTPSAQAAPAASHQPNRRRSPLVAMYAASRVKVVKNVSGAVHDEKAAGKHKAAGEQ